MNPYKEIEEQIYGVNPLAPDVGGYEGMTVQYLPESGYEFPERSLREESDVLAFAEEVGLLDEVRERAYAIYLNNANIPIGHRLLSAGGRAETLVDFAVVFGPAMALHAGSIIIFHNHPSGRLRFSQTDKQLISELLLASKLLNVRLLDFVIVSKKGFVSAREVLPKYDWK